MNDNELEKRLDKIENLLIGLKIDLKYVKEAADKEYEDLNLRISTVSGRVWGLLIGFTTLIGEGLLALTRML